jgi:hypothetical protein
MVLGCFRNFFKYSNYDIQYIRKLSDKKKRKSELHGTISATS